MSRRWRPIICSGRWSSSLISEWCRRRIRYLSCRLLVLDGRLSCPSRTPRRMMNCEGLGCCSVNFLFRLFTFFFFLRHRHRHRHRFHDSIGLHQHCILQGDDHCQLMNSADNWDRAHQFASNRIFQYLALFSFSNSRAEHSNTAFILFACTNSSSLLFLTHLPYICSSSCLDSSSVLIDLKRLIFVSFFLLLGYSLIWRLDICMYVYLFAILFLVLTMNYLSMNRLSIYLADLEMQEDVAAIEI